MSDGSWRQVFKEILPQFLSVFHITAKGAEPLEELHEVDVSTAILVEDVCEILSANILNSQYSKFNIDQMGGPFIKSTDLWLS